jgi:branched-chain amino acid transport system ATP-binding protein
MKAPGPPILELVGVEARYRNFRALFGVDLRVDTGSALAIVGANGAGKSTVARVASGLVAPTAGSVRLAGQDMTGRPPHEFARAGLAHAPEGRAVFASLTVEDNLALAFRNCSRIDDSDAATEEAFALFPRLKGRRRQLAGTLSGGEQRMLTLARVMVLRPRLLIADELSLGLAPLVTGEVYETLARIRDQGCALLVVEQHIDHALALADHVVVIRKGEVVHRGPASDGLDPQMLLGRAARQSGPPEATR